MLTDGGTRRRLLDSFRFNRVVTANLRIKAVSEILVKLVRFLLVVAAARLLGPARFGLYSFAFAFGSILSTAADFGLHLHLSREVALQQGPPAGALGRALWAKILLSAVVALALVASALFYPRPLEVRALLLLSGIWLLAQSWCDFWNSYFRGLQSLKEEALLNLLNAVLGTGLGLALLAAGRGVFALFTALLLAALATNGTALLLLSRRAGLPRRSSPAAARSVIREAAPIGFALLLTTLYFRIDMIFLERLRGDAEVGAYSAAYRLLESFLFLPAIFMAALYPALAEASRVSAREMRRLFHAGLRWMSLLSLAIVAGIIIFAPWGLRVVYGVRYDEAGRILRLLCPSLLFIFPNYVLMHLLVAVRGQRWNAVLAAAGVVVNVGLNFPAVRLYGAAGAAVVTFLTEAVLFTLGVAAVRHRLRLLADAETHGTARGASPEGAAL